MTRNPYVAGAQKLLECDRGIYYYRYTAIERTRVNRLGCNKVLIFTQLIAVALHSKLRLLRHRRHHRRLVAVTAKMATSVIVRVRAPDF